MGRRLALIAVVVALLGVPTTAAAAAPPTPPCPDVEGWAFTKSFGPIDKPISVQFSCQYARAGQPEALTLDVDWVKPIARDVDVDFNECKRPASGGAYYRDVWSGKAFVRLEYIVNAGTAASNAAVFAAERARIERSALVFLAATEKLAKSCGKGAPSTTRPTPIRDTHRPGVQVEPAAGKAGTTVVFGFKVSDNSSPVGVMLTIYDGRSKEKIAFRKDYGKAKPGRYTIKIRPHERGVQLWCITATDTAANKATACSKLVVS
jgi:hypothetical protein